MEERREQIMQEMNSSGRTPVELSTEFSLSNNALTLFAQRQELKEEEQSVKELLKDSSGDKDMKEECLGELRRVSSEMEILDSKIVDAVLPKETD
eukprot:CAMPEP_0198152378 /NCGR_PEP_ID=MMETSP1443-20131203/59610_1 /TAXON_ID=186043 /ORGANISM="Entomoneis sp., Strain CCMP2396" /LENGTH=94 /DNA_ID=CAMNT_0043818383 /DNA_START=223 /DNA_END=504 /DNA_ORIENTATION=+